MASTVTPHEDMDPSPRVDVFIDAADLDGDTVTITVHQISVAGDIEVRNMRGVSAAGGYAATDYEPPFGVPITYRVQQFDAGGAELGYVLSLVAQVDIADGMAVLSDPLVPGVAVMVEAHTDFGSELRRSRPTRVYRAGYQTRALMGLQSLLEDVPLRCQTKTLDDADALEEVLAGSGFLVRLMPSGGRLPLLLHVVVSSPVQVPVDVQYGGEWIQWDLTGQQITAPTIDILVAVINYGRFADYMNTLPDNSYGNAAAIWSTYLDAMLNPPPAV
jgi:hypothetical protein